MSLRAKPPCPTDGGEASSSWVVYILACADSTFYTGITNDLEHRLQMHNAGRGAKYTRGRLPVAVVHVEACSDHGTALRRERAIKRLSRKEKVRLIGGDIAQKESGTGLDPRS